MNKNKWLIIITVFFLAGCLFLSYHGEDLKGEEKDPAISSEEDIKSAPFELHMLDVGQGMSVLVRCRDHWMIYDGGGADTSSFVVAYLKKQGVKKLDYVIASHYDQDHISGLVGVMNVFSCGTVFSPDYEADTDIYRSFTGMTEKKGLKVIHPEQGQVYKMGPAELEITGPYTYSYTEENDRSICVRIGYKGTHYLMCGDAGSQPESDMVSMKVPLRSDVLFVSHHGSNYSSTEEFLDAVKPRYALVSCGLGNSYGHPAGEVLERLKARGCILYRTDLQKSVVLYSDGKTIQADQETCANWESGESLNAAGAGGVLTLTDSTEETDDTLSRNKTDEGEYTYVCNLNTMKFHYSNCSSVDKMSEKNKRYTNESREELIRQGFESCGNCNP